MGTVTLEASRTRLHITPFNEDLLDRFVPPAIRPQATNISFHSVQTFSERGFGYVELPTTEAQKIKQKLNGMTLKGSKVKIEEARPEKRSKDKKRKSSADVDENVEVEAEKDAKATKRAKRSRVERGEGIINGHELDPERIVKRGWQDTVPKKRGSKKDEKASDVILEGKSNLFKTSIAPNAMPLKSSKKESSKSDAKKKTKVKERKSSKHDVVVKEFKNTTKILGTKSTKTSKPETHYEDGVGWVDGDGNVIEAEAPASRRKRAFLAVQPASTPQEPQTRKVVEPQTREAVETVSSESEPESEEEPVGGVTNPDPQPETTSDRSGSEAPSITATATSIEVPISDDIDPDSPTTPPTIIKPSETADLPEREIHPLEALYKRPAPSKKSSKAAETLPPIDTGFSFFGSGGTTAERESDDEGIDDGPSAEPTAQHPPHTPHTKLDLEWRGTRSGAPTPDTAAIGKRFSFPLAEDDEDDEDDDEDDGDEAPEISAIDATSPSRKIGDKGAAEGEESEFRKWFYENRGELNRGWKKRRREEKKLKRQRESRRLGRKIA
jgi:hypothetical protein